ncbi:alpha/beta hydrolase [Aliivibrio sifiae]|uniref:Alpha/beta hydrolase n=1 Tax=Aliivibrio sifiae TaxID=566293 RepID=A0A2S7X4Q2_9GAMM|nr:alpha/beta hydrolase [Aliivibrio sifiae]PQJ85142.1 alpha/beta hydrolase [Aliivibrio sifiae]
MKFAVPLALSLLTSSVMATSLDIYDASRERNIPITVDFPVQKDLCTTSNKCKVAFVSAGFKVPYLKYQLMVQNLNEMGYLTVAVDHELPNDPPLSKKGDLYQTRIENWKRGAETLDFLQSNISLRYPEYDFQNILLVGHSNGGDISAWLASENKSYISKVITLDHRRVALPKTARIQVLSIRATEYPTVASALLTEKEQSKYHSCIVEIENSKHMDLTDYGSEKVINKVRLITKGFLSGESCAKLKQQA